MSNTPHIPTASECIAILGGLHHWKHRCHEASLALVKHPSFPANARVVRGWHPQIQSQHSWVVLGEAYDPEAIIIDPVLWSYLKGHHPAVFIGPAEKLPHVPHGAGMLMDHENPPPPIKTQVITLAKKLSLPARKFLKSIAPKGLDLMGWHWLAHRPVQGWPSKEIITAMAGDKRLSALIPIDIKGNLTDLNPNGLYRR